MRLLPRVVILSAVLLVVLLSSSSVRAECERLYAGGINQTCRAAQTPTVTQVNLEVVTITNPTDSSQDSCHLNAVIHGDFSSWRKAIDDGKVNKGGGSLRMPGRDWMSIYYMDLTSTEFRVDFYLGSQNPISYNYLLSKGLPHHTRFLSQVNMLEYGVREADTGYTWKIPITPPRESANLPVLYQKCMRDIELAREKKRRAVYIDKQELAIELARESALAEIEFLNGEITTMENALANIGALITQATEAINTALEKRRRLITLEEQYAETVNAFWAEQTQAYMTFSMWANERLSNIDKQLAQAEQFKATIEQLESEFQAELQATRERIQEKVKELEALAAQGTNGEDN